MTLPRSQAIKGKGSLPLYKQALMRSPINHARLPQFTSGGIQKGSFKNDGLDRNEESDVYLFQRRSFGIFFFCCKRELNSRLPKRQRERVGKNGRPAAAAATEIKEKKLCAMFA